MQKKPGALLRVKSLVAATCLRRTKASSAVALELPDRAERIELVTLSGDDQELYDYFEDKTASMAAGISDDQRKKIGSKASEHGNILSMMNILRLVCNHGKDLLSTTALNIWAHSRNSLVDWRSIETSYLACSMCGQDLEETAQVSEATGTQALCASCVIGAEDVTEERRAQRPQKHGEFWQKARDASNLSRNILKPSPKVEALLKNLRAEQSYSSGEVPIKR